MIVRECRFLAATLLLGMMVGCGPEMVDVKGKVSYGGKALTGGTIIFAPEDAEAPTSTGTIEADGSFELTDGAVVGQHRVTVTGEVVAGTEGEIDDEEADDDESVAAATTALVADATVVDGENDLAIDFTRQAGSGGQYAGGRNTGGRYAGGRYADEEDDD